MPRRSILSATDLANLLTLPEDDDEFIRRYTLGDTDLALIRQRRGAANRLGFAIQLCYMRYPGVMLTVETQPSERLLRLVAGQLKADPTAWSEYGQRAETRREHVLELQAVFGFRSFTNRDVGNAVRSLQDLAMQSDKGIVLAEALVAYLRQQRLLLPSLGVIERVCAEAVTAANRRIYAMLTNDLSSAHRGRLDALLKRRDDGKSTMLTWLRQSPAKANSRSMLEHIDRLRAWQALQLPAGIERQVHQNRLLKMAREGAQMIAADLAKFEPERRYATLVALAVEATATVIDEIIELHDRIMGKLFSVAKRKHEDQFQASGKAINAKLRLYGQIGQALLEAKLSGGDAFAAIESVMPWSEFAESVTDAQKLAQPEDFDFLRRIGESYATLRRYSPQLLDVLQLRAAAAANDVLDALNLLRRINTESERKVPDDAPTDFIKPRWLKLVITDDGIDRRYYELCALSELKNALRSGDIWVQGSRQFKDFSDYLLPADKFTSLRQASALALPIETDCEKYLSERMALLEQQLDTVNQMALDNDLPDAVITASGLSITPLVAAVPDAAQQLIDRSAALLPHVKIPELLMEVDRWTNFTRHFTHLKTGDVAKDKTLLLTTILADGINLGLSKMNRPGFCGGS